MARKFDVLKAMERRDKKLARANKLYQQMRKLEAEAEDIDMKISDHCTHPKSHLKLKKFSEEIPQKTTWLCTICYQSVEYSLKTREQMLEDSLRHLFEGWDEIPEGKINPPKK